MEAEMERQVVGGDEGMQGDKVRVTESGYSSMVSSQKEGQSQSQSQGRQMLGEEQLKEFAGKSGVVKAGEAEGEGEGEGERSGYPSLLVGTQGGHVEDRVGGGSGVGRDLVQGDSSPVLSRFAPPPPPPPHSHPQRAAAVAQPQAQGHPAPAGGRATDGLPPLPEKIEEVVPRLSSPPSTPPKIHANICQQSPNNAVSASTPTSGPPPPPAVAGAKRTSSGKLKAAVTVGIPGSGGALMPGSPMEVVVSPAEASVEVGPGCGGDRLGMGLSSLGSAVDPERMQELTTQLRTRLKYARIKVDNNWTTKSLDQVESIYHSNQNSPARSSNNNGLPTPRVNRDSPPPLADGPADFGPPIHVVSGGKRGHSRTNSEPGNQQYGVMGIGMGGQGMQGPRSGARQGSEKTYESFWKERAPFTMKMLEKMTTGGPQSQPGGQYYQQQSQGHGQGQGQHQQSQYSQQHTPHHHHHHHHPQQAYSQVRSPAPGGEPSRARDYPSPHHSHFNHHLHSQQQQQATSYSSSHRTIRPPPTLTPSHSNLSTYSETSTTITTQPPATPIRHPTLSRGTSSKSAEEEAVESLMFLMSSPGSNSTPRREPRTVQGYALNMPRRGSILSRENSNGWGRGDSGEVDLDVTDAEGGSGSGSGMEGVGEEEEVPPIWNRRVEGGRGGEAEVGPYARRRSNSGSGVMGGRYERDGRLGVPGGGSAKLKHHHPHLAVGMHVGHQGHSHGHQERVTKPSAGSTPKKKLGVGIGIVANRTVQGTPGARRLAPGFSPS